MPSSLSVSTVVSRPTGLAGLSPAYFALVMATGIVSLAAHMEGHDRLAHGLLYLNVVAWSILALLYLARLIRHPGSFLADLADHGRGPGFLTVVAGTAVLASQFLLLTRHGEVGLALAALAALLWFVLIYAIFLALTVKRDKPTLDLGISGSWLLAVVATQSLAVLGALIAARGGAALPWRLELNFAALALWLWGGMLYIWTMALIFYRYTFFSLTPETLTPPYWINMGAMAISTLAGSLLIANASTAPFLGSLLPFLKGFTVFYWASGTWWIPMLLLLGIWRYLVRRHALRYDPLYWGAVFPLGMYSVCTHQMAQVLDLGFLGFVAPLFFRVALAAWAVAFLGLAWQLLHARAQPAG